MATFNPLPLFESHGVKFEGFTDNQAYGVCPFTGKSKKFYVNKTTGLWDSKVSGQSGNIDQFLTAIAHQYHANLTPPLLKKLAADRGLPPDAFDGWNIGWTGTEYTVPAAGPDGLVTDIRFYTPGKKMRSTTGAKTNLFGAHRLKEDKTDLVFVCEGEWDAVAWLWALRQAGKVGAVVGVPGAATFKADWATYMRNKRLFLMYDADAAGQTGMNTAAERCANTASAIGGLVWPENTPDGWDVRDEVKGNSSNILRIQVMVKRLMGAFQDVRQIKGMKGATKTPPTPPPERAHLNGHGGLNGHSKGPTRGPEPNTFGANPILRKSQWKHGPSLKEVETQFRKWLFLDNTDALKVMLACIVSQHIDGSPIWVFLVAPPGGSKTEHLNALSMVENVMMTSSLTPHSLISGANFKSNEDPSLIPQLDGKILVIKDFTAIIGMRDADKEEIFAILRDAYDGHCGKVFGNGIQRKYDSRFTILGAVTPRIYDLGSNHASLGERFLKFTLGDNLDHTSEEDIIRRAITNINRETTMRAELADVVNAFLSKTVKTDVVPVVPEDIMARIIPLSKFGARLRGTVSRDTYRNDIMVSRPSAEVGSRLGVQMAKLGQALAMVEGKPVVGANEYRLMKKTMLDTIPQRFEDIVRHTLTLCPTRREYVTSRQLEEVTRYPSATVIRLLQDMMVLNIVRRTGEGGRPQYTLSDYIRKCITDSGLYTTEEEVSRKAIVGMRARRKPATATAARV